uniref:Uncharacterized protein n=1 Tax=Gracilinema caldarium TaxID=215591 RepID=A0A7C3IJS0_9SPIR
MEQVLNHIQAHVGSTNTAMLPEDITKAFEQFRREKAALEKNIKTYEEELKGLRQLKNSVDELCPVHVPVDISGRWNALIDREWDKVNKDALDNLNTIKLMNDQNQEFISEVIKEFGEQQNTFTSFSQKYRVNMEEYARNAETAKKAVLDELDHSSQKIEDTFAQFIQVEDITEKIKMISLNLSIEASKVRGSESFSFLARELRRLAQSTEETIKGISTSIKDTVVSMKHSREDQVRDLTTMDSILQEFEKLLKEYDDASGKLHTYMRRAIDRININQEDQKTILLNFFKTLQQIAITKEELEHKVQYYEIFVRQTNEYVQKVLRSDKQCRGTACPQRRAVMDELAKIANTDEERRMVNELFKELLGEDREAQHGSLAGALKGDSNDFISFN